MTKDQKIVFNKAMKRTQLIRWLDKQKLQLSNQIRGLLLEFGIIISPGASSFKKRIPEILEDAENDLSAAMLRV